MAKKVDWRKMKAEYASNLTVTHRSLAEKYGVSSTIVSKRAAEENWSQARKDYSEKVVQQMLQASAGATAQVLARFSAAADKALTEIEKALADPQQFYRYRVEANADERKETGYEEVERVYKTLNTKALKEVTDTAKGLLDLYRNATGTPEWGTQFSAITSYLKLENEREKLAFERGKAAAEGTTDELIVRFEDANGEDGSAGGFDA